MAQRAKVKIICPTCDGVYKNMKPGDKEQGGENKCKECGEMSLLPRVLVLEPAPAAPPSGEED